MNYLLKDAGDETVAILNHNVASAYLVPSGLYENMMDIIDDHHLSKIVDDKSRLKKLKDIVPEFEHRLN